VQNNCLHQQKQSKTTAFILNSGFPGDEDLPICAWNGGLAKVP
jgi:hypothetical protein